MSKSTPALILMAMIGKSTTRAADVVVVDTMIVGCGAGMGEIDGAAEGVSSVLYGSRAPIAMNGAAVGNPSGPQAGR